MADITQLRSIAAKFGKDFKSMKQPSHAILPTVFILDEAFVLRARPLADLERFQKWTSLLQQIAPKIPYQVAQPLPTTDGHLSIEEGGQYWFLAPFLPGKILGKWQEIALAQDEDTRRVLGGLKILHEATKGFDSLNLEDPMGFTKDIAAKLKEAGHLLSAHANQRIQTALRRVEEFEKTLSLKDLCFVHGDFQHANVIVDAGKKITGLIDFDYCRMGYKFEDLAFTIMMCLRSYDAESFHFDDLKYQKLLQWYGLSSDQHSIFAEYLILASVIDLWSFSNVGLYGEMQNREFYLKYQISLLHALAVRFGSEHDAPLPEQTGPVKFPVDLSEKYLSMAAELKIFPKDISERFVRGSGHGGQKINKTSSCVELHHGPSGTDVRVQEFREQHKNRIAAYKRLFEKVEEKMKGRESQRGKEVFKIRKQKARRGRKAKEKMLKEKKIRGQVKEARRRPQE